MPPDIGHRERDVVRKRARAIHAHAHGVRAQMAAPGETITASAANHVTLATYQIAGEEVRNVGADLDDAADEFVPNGHRHRDCLLRPRVPLVDMDIGAAN